MNINDLQIVCVGNSHLASFSHALKKALLDVEDVSLKFWPIQYMNNPWNNFKANNYLTAPKFKADNPAGLTDDKALENKTILILVGLGLYGNFIFYHFGSLVYANPNETTNGYACSPLMPIVYGSSLNELAASSHVIKRDAPCCSISMCKNMFTNSINYFLNQLHLISSNSNFKYVYCVPAPNMPERVARWRLGEDYCDSGSQRIINDIYRQTLEYTISQMELSDKVIVHDTSFENELGFVDNMYANSNAKNDNHVSQAYYEHLVCELLDRITKQNSMN